MDEETPARAERSHDDLVILYGAPRRSTDDRSISFHSRVHNRRSPVLGAPPHSVCCKKGSRALPIVAVGQI